MLPITATTDPNQVISLLAGYVSGRPLEIEVALSGALLLVFASNTAIIGATMSSWHSHAWASCPA